MSILGYPFKYDNNFSKQYGLAIASINTNKDNTIIDNEKDTTTLFLPCNNQFIIQGIKPKSPLSFDIEFISDTTNQAITPIQSHNITKWLFDRLNYHRFEIFSKDYSNIYFNCRFTKAEKINSGVGIIGYKCTVECDAPWAWEKERPSIYNITSTPSFIKYICNSDSESYLIPQNLQITCGQSGGTVSITNINDNNHIIQFYGLLANEIISLDSFGQVISSTSNKRFTNWNHKFLRFVNGDNTLNVSGDISKISITCDSPRRCGY